MKKFILSIALLLSGSLNAQSIQIEDEVCRYQGQFDDKKYSAQQFQDTMEMILRHNPLLHDIDHRNSVHEIKQAYEQHINTLNNLKLLPHPVFATARKQMQAQSEFFRDLALVESRAIHEQNPKILLTFQPQLTSCQTLANKVTPEALAAAKHYAVADRISHLSVWHNCVNHAAQPEVALHTDDAQNGNESARKAYFSFFMGKPKQVHCDEP